MKFETMSETSSPEEKKPSETYEEKVLSPEALAAKTLIKIGKEKIEITNGDIEKAFDKLELKGEDYIKYLTDVSIEIKNKLKYDLSKEEAEGILKEIRSPLAILSASKDEKFIKFKKYFESVNSFIINLYPELKK